MAPKAKETLQKVLDMFDAIPFLDSPKDDLWAEVNAWWNESAAPVRDDVRLYLEAQPPS